MSRIHLVVPDLFLPQRVAVEACAGLALPALQALLARGGPAPLRAESLEAWLCAVFGVKDQAIAPVTLRADGMEPEACYWLRADPVHLSLQRDQLILLPDVMPTADEAAQLCASLNRHFSTEGLRFFAVHPRRWYLRLDAAPEISTSPLPQVLGCNVYEHLPQGADALRWHSVFNEIQMLMYGHEVNQAREARGELPINSVWLWGGGLAGDGELRRPYTEVSSDCELASAFARAAGISHGALTGDATRGVGDVDGEVLVVWEGLRRSHQHGDLHAWRESVQRLELCCARPLLGALRAGRIARLTLDIPQAGAPRRFEWTPAAAWKLWRRSKSLADYAI